MSKPRKWQTCNDFPSILARTRLFACCKAVLTASMLRKNPPVIVLSESLKRRVTEIPPLPNFKASHALPLKAIRSPHSPSDNSQRTTSYPDHGLSHLLSARHRINILYNGEKFYFVLETSPRCGGNNDPMPLAWIVISRNNFALLPQSYRAFVKNSGTYSLWFSPSFNRSLTKPVAPVVLISCANGIPPLGAVVRHPSPPPQCIGQTPYRII
jgi:hypothetical protein